MEVKIRTLTHLWTGGIDGEVDRIHETGILGSLRWWMEVLVRGMGGNACDPTEQKCSSKNGLCEVCKVFGAEGQKRRFRLEVLQDNTQSDKIVSSKHDYKDKEGKTKTRISRWLREKKPISGTFTVQVQSLHLNFNPEIVVGLIQFIADWSALGARPQMGFGVIQVEGGSRIDTQTLYDWLKQVEDKHEYPDLPSLHNIFLSKIQPKDSNKASTEEDFTEEDTFNLKYDLRQLFRPQAESDNLKSLRHFIMGTVEDDRQAAKIKISRPYNENGTTVMRVWGWIPESAKVCLKNNPEKDLYTNDWNREKVMDTIHQHLNKNYTLQVWREMNSPRDTVTPNENDVQSFLCSLLNPQENSHANS
ncbi:type III-B CRISPR module RAMP protein Cmr1 [Leptothermofonsia sp. ETS-13]|uniref:type III-B CRISPR module RAMP protein Cmr1 n=1 Tax=Leptothermofonsia sp. ETS-13 TaxID=3035696 RepID=UPI003B9DED00